MLVQIAITGQYWINKGIDDWSGVGEVPQCWRPKNSHTELVVCNVKLADMSSVIADLRARLNDFGWSNQASSFDAYDVVVMPNRLSPAEFIEWEYSVYDEILSISQAEIDRFNKMFTAVLVEDPPADKYDDLVA